MYEYRKLTPEQKAAVVEERLKKGFPPHSPPHPIENSEYYLITATCYEHKCRINTHQRRQQLLNLIFQQFIYKDIDILAWVILPNHYHLLLKNIRFYYLRKILRSIHGNLARQWNKEDNTAGKIWCSFSDRAIRSQGHYYTTLNYIHYNPVKHDWAESPYDWSESSVYWYLENYGREWLRSNWVEYPVRDFGKSWDDL
ncbi:REP-associated tyrosine transposase [Calothrix sp. CCY 0018]|uniref:REP-associated tyrosine transposase n=1 Tax=Calothrix sp. CCY 0018 TaxID=3103864 RepID=UPI0039C5AB2D